MRPILGPLVFGNSHTVIRRSRALSQTHSGEQRRGQFEEKISQIGALLSLEVSSNPQGYHGESRCGMASLGSTLCGFLGLLKP